VIRTVAMILFTLAVMAAVQTRIEARLGLHCATFDSHMGLRS